MASIVNPKISVLKIPESLESMTQTSIDVLNMLRARKGLPVYDLDQWNVLVSRFDCMEQSILWQCMNNKIGDAFHYKLDKIVRKHMNDNYDKLYRGLSRREAKAFYQSLISGTPFDFGKVSSFTVDECIAREFAGKWHYATHVIIQLNECEEAFDFHHNMKALLITAPDSEFMRPNDDWDNIASRRSADIEMIDKEQERMLPMGTKFKVTGHNKVEKSGLLMDYFSVTIA
ncbi:ADP-rybosylase [Klebsiella phage PKO111]|uniref:NAD--protein ADP-ribosyltransferase modB n=1 Tax=Klebsiella phage PKO111 TaxID=1654928 RepID=A0A161BYV2_9CAUD|nr:RNA polymerase ADP-ribosylase [Klebsiella phage PKO111]AKJ73181.1 ADP-rybosylase [Klebsiella phage PKO111]